MHPSKSISKGSTDKYFLQTALFSILITIVLARLGFLLLSGIYYNTAVSDSLYTGVYYLANAIHSSALSVSFSFMICAFFLHRGGTTIKTILFSVLGIVVFHLSAFFADLINGLISTTWVSVLCYNITQIFVEILLETTVLIVILLIVCRKDRSATPVSSLISVRNKPQCVILIFSFIFFAECFIPDAISTVEFLMDAEFSLYPSELFEILSVCLENVLLYLIEPFLIMTFLYSRFSNKKV